MARTYVVLRRMSPETDAYELADTVKAESARDAINQVSTAERGDLTAARVGEVVQYTAVPARNWTSFDISVDMRVNFTEVELFTPDADEDELDVDKILEEYDAQDAEDYAEAEKVADEEKLSKAEIRKAAVEEDPVTEDEDLWGGGDDK